MIIIGYQGIGKSTHAGTEKFIDLESGNFWVDGKRSDDWYKVYCNIAVHLSRQGYDVFVSSHEVVRKELAKYDENIIIICPDTNLKEEWIHKLKTRWESTGLDKDYKAYMNAEDKFEDNINELKYDENFCTIIIRDMKYNLRGLVEAARYIDKMHNFADYYYHK